MRRLFLPAIAGVFWLVLLVTSLSSGVRPARSGHDAISTHLQWLMTLCAPLRHAFAQATRELPGVGGQLVMGLTTGDTSRLRQSLSDDMRATALTHLTAVSGANCQIVVIATVGLLSLVGLPRWTRMAGASVMLLAFVAFVGPQASVLRAATMSLAVFVGLALGRLTAGLPALAVSVIFLLCIEPTWAVDYGFALSVLATLGIVTLTDRLSAYMQRGSLRIGQRRLRLGRKLALVLAVPLAATLLCQPVIILISPTMPTYGILANALAEPAAGLATILGMMATVAAAISTSLGQAVAWLAWVPSEWIGQVAQFFARLPFAQLPWRDSVVGASVAAVLSASVIALIVGGKRLPRVVRLIALSLVIGGVSASVWAGASTVVHEQGAVPGSWDIAMCDVGQGDAILLHSVDPMGAMHTALIDTGRSPQAVSKCLHRASVTRIDLLVLTHFDLDHIGGVDAVVSLAANILIGTPGDASDQLVLRQLQTAVPHVTLARVGMSGVLGAATWNVLWPDGVTPNMQSGNPGSVAMMWNVDGIHAAFLADLGQGAQETILAHEIDLASVDVLKVAHHGSADTSEQMVRRLHPRLALISVGTGNKYGHPTTRAMAQLEAVGAKIERTDVQGMVFISRRDDRLVVTTDR